MGGQEGIETLADVSLWRGIPEYIRSDNGPEFIAQQLRPCLAKVGDRDTVHRAWKPVGERILRKFFNGKFARSALV